MGWITGSEGPRRVRRKRPVEVVVTVKDPVKIEIPPFDFFYPAHIAKILRVDRQNVHYWIDNFKLTVKRDFFGIPYVTRAELVTFVKEFYRRPVE